MRSNNETSGQDYHSSIEEARRAQIIAFAIETIAELGYAQASLARIAERAKVSKSVILYHFTSKDRLMEQIVTDTYKEALCFILPRIPMQANASEQLRAYIQADIDFMKTHPQKVAALLEIMLNLRTSEGKLHFDTQTEEPILAGLEEFLRKGQKDGVFRAFNTRVMAVTLRRALDAIPPLLAANPSLDLDTYTQELMELFDRATRKE